ncbi:hypothetical protein DERF_011587 [Dermatophagoides farinae]|uniref:Uncharacterized protein n=1 Tax=Dermatophagoides farinae TaxID=6954 RepID=A0A922KZP5_DERFA|nr:hypothetical protein DERF_011587 [Dermatophagoides farinae]
MTFGATFSETFTTFTTARHYLREFVKKIEVTTKGKRLRSKARVNSVLPLRMSKRCRFFARKLHGDCKGAKAMESCFVCRVTDYMKGFPADRQSSIIDR